MYQQQNIDKVWNQAWDQVWNKGLKKYTSTSKRVESHFQAFDLVHGESGLLIDLFKVDVCVGVRPRHTSAKESTS